ncbi:Fe-S oxidoreductase [Microbacterium halotolerans]|uniref:Fe-S oxidoreductase n=1 Tax=Microbacterium halotolerans TaxID=246613 RepID=UPI001F09F50F|nr:Fe-S oxidoreductase [Microbacterium halotolerans]
MRLWFPRDAPPADWHEIAELRAEHGRELDRHIPPFLLDSPVSRTGCWIATAFGFAWGTLWSIGRVERSGELFVFRGMPRFTHARGGVCVGRCFLTHRASEPARVRDHERVHLRQWRRYGLLMPVLYLLAGRDPLRNRFEIDAGLADGGYITE